MIELNEETKSNLEYLLGITLKDLEQLDVSEEIVYLEQRGAGKLSFAKKRDLRKAGRGNPLLARKRIRTMEDVNKRLDRMKW